VTFIKALGLWDVVAMNIVAVVGLRWIARSARVGAPSVTLWILAALAFFVPLAIAVSRLAQRYPEQGGIYTWVRRAFGPVNGFICGWCVWVNNLFYFPSLLLFAAANVPVAFGMDPAALAENRLY
jgi:amino acid transporter